MECVFLFGPIVGAGEMVVSEMVFMFPFDIFFFEWSMQTIDQSRAKANVVCIRKRRNRRLGKTIVATTPASTLRCLCVEVLFCLWLCVAGFSFESFIPLELNSC